MSKIPAAFLTDMTSRYKHLEYIQQDKIYLQNKILPTC